VNLKLERKSFFFSKENIRFACRGGKDEIFASGEAKQVYARLVPPMMINRGITMSDDVREHLKRTEYEVDRITRRMRGRRCNALVLKTVRYNFFR
jgi:hypothetical protein